MKYKSKKGWYTLQNPNKFIPPVDTHMKSFNESSNSIEFKSSLEEKAWRYFDLVPKVKRFSIEPLYIPYLSPKDNRYHRYFIDAYVEFEDKKFLVEVKSSNETVPPKKPKKSTSKSEYYYQKAVMTYKINQAKWNSTINYCKDKGLNFIILTEKELG